MKTVKAAEQYKVIEVCKDGELACYVNCKTLAAALAYMEIATAEQPGIELYAVQL